MFTRRLLVLISTLFCLLDGNAQVSAYTFSQNAGTYTALASSTTVHAAGWDDAVTSVAIPFTFVFNGTGYTACNVSSNGFITFGATTPGTTNYTPISSAVAYSGAVSAMGIDMISTGGGGSIVVYATEGTFPNRTFVVQWNNARRFDAYTGNWDFQIRLSETSNVVTVRYGACGASNTNNIITSQVGLRGLTNADYNNRNLAANSAWLTSTTGVANTASMKSRDLALPANGTTFIWTPPAYKAQLVSMNTGSVNWCAGETRNISITLQNTGTQPWIDGTPVGSNFQVGVKWNADVTYSVNVDAGGLAAGGTSTYTLSVTAPITPGTNNLTFDVGNVSCPLWFGTNTSSCGLSTGLGNRVFVSAGQNIKSRPTVNAGIDDTICGSETAQLNGSVVMPTIPTTILSQDFSGGSLPVGWSRNSDGGYNPNVIWRHYTEDPVGGILTTTNANGFMFVDSDEWGSFGMAVGNAYLTMPSLNLSAYTSVNFSMSHYYEQYGASTGTLQMSLDGGGIWTNINVWNASTANAQNYSVSVPAAAGQTNVMFRFRFSGTWDLFWVVDDIIISGVASVVPITYVWTGVPVVSNTGILNPTTNTPYTTNYTLTATADGCSASDMMTVVVDDCSPLPVVLSAFSASCENNNVIISWATESQQNCDYFRVETSRDGQTWEEVAHVLGAGNSTSHLDYAIVDENAIFGVSYYRLKQVDFDGMTKLYGPISLNCESSDGNVVLYPNPTSSSFTIKAEADYPEILVVKMVDVTGRVLLEQPWYIKKGTNQFPFDGLSCGNGVYFVSLIKEDGSSFIKKINKEEPTLQVVIKQFGFMLS